jgi:iron complex outermembrane receptor protein
VKGAELEVSLFPAEGFTIDGSVSVLDFKYTSPTTSAGFLVNTGIDADNITPYTPELAYSVGAQYDHPLAAGNLSFRLDGNYQGKVFSNGENTSWAKIDGRFLTNAKITYAREETWKVALEVQNLFNKYYFMSKSDVSAGSLGVVTGVPGLPRTWAVSVERKF